MNDTTDEDHALRLRRCKSAALAREMSTETFPTKGMKRLCSPEWTDQAIAADTLPKEEKAPELRRCKSAVGRMIGEGDLYLDQSVKPRRCQSVEEPMLTKDFTEDNGLRRCQSTA